MADFKTALEPVRMRNRKRWFEKLDTYLVLWWLPAGYEPTIDEASGSRSRVGRPSPLRQAPPPRSAGQIEQLLPDCFVADLGDAHAGVWQHP